MKKIMILLVIVFAKAAAAQNNPIFYGGAGDGWSTSTYTQASNLTINHGSAGDGWTTASYLQAANSTINHGAAGDGWSAASHMPVSNVTMYHGDSSDGYHMRNYMPNVVSPSNYGNQGDGWALNNHMPVISQTLYKGGAGDGWASDYLIVSPLPVELLSFTGKEDAGTHVLNWTTSIEINSSHFEVEHSSNASSFLEIGRVGAAGNSATEKDYTFTNAKPNIGNNYYRLKIVDIDGHSKYSNVLLLYLMKDNTSLILYPNPAATMLHIEMQSELNNAKMSFQIVDMSGKIVKEQSVKKDKNIYQVDVSALANGIYFMKVISGNNAEIIKFSISK